MVREPVEQCRRHLRGTPKLKLNLELRQLQSTQCLAEKLPNSGRSIKGREQFKGSGSRVSGSGGRQSRVRLGFPQHWRRLPRLPPRVRPVSGGSAAQAAHFRRRRGRAKYRFRSPPRGDGRHSCCSVPLFGNYHSACSLVLSARGGSERRGGIRFMAGVSGERQMSKPDGSQIAIDPRADSSVRRPWDQPESSRSLGWRPHGRASRECASPPKTACPTITSGLAPERCLKMVRWGFAVFGVSSGIDLRVGVEPAGLLRFKAQFCASALRSSGDGSTRCRARSIRRPPMLRNLEFVNAISCRTMYLCCDCPLFLCRVNSTT